MTPGAKSPMATIAPFGLSENTFATDVGMSVCSAPSVPPTMSSDLPTMSFIIVSAFLTDGSVHGIWCVASLSYMSAPAVRR